MDKLDLRCIILLFLLSFFVCSFLPVKKNAKFTSIFAFDEPFLLDEREELFFYGLKSIFFSRSFALNQSFFDFPINQSVDVLWRGDKVYLTERPLYLLTNLLPASVGFSLRDDLLAYNLLRVSHIIYFSLSICLFYLFGRKFYLSRRTSFLSSVLFAFSTGMLIYSKMFLSQIFDLMLILSFYVSVLYGMEKLSYVFLFLLSINLYTPSWLLLVSPFFFLKLERKFFLCLVVVFLFSLPFKYILPPYGLENKWECKLFGHYPRMVGEFVEFMPYLSNMHRKYYVYSIEGSDALFLDSYGLFGSMFSERGFVYNSPFLVFSLLGAVYFQKRKRKDKFYFLLSLFFINLLAAFSPGGWHGGSTPRYVRFYFPAVSVLTLFSAYFFEKEKRNWLKLLFAVAVFLSTLNIWSMAVRLDLSYELPKDLVSYDYFLFPTAFEQVLEWNLSGGEGCVAYFERGIVTDPCGCDRNSWAEVMVYLTSNKTLHLLACADFAGGDGTRGYVYIDSRKYEIYVPSENCVEWKVSVPKGKHKIRLQSGIYGNCDAEAVRWESVRLS